MREKIKIFARSPAQKDPRALENRAAYKPEVKVSNLADTTVIDLYGPIGGWDGITAADFKRALNGITSPNIQLNINSPGGDVFEGIAIHNDLVAHAANIAVNVTGVAASAASVVAMAGDTVAMGDGAFLMIHNAWTVAVGDQRAMNQTGAMLAKVDKTIAEFYAKRTGIDAAELADMMNAETWIDAQAAVDMGFADSAMSSDAAENASAKASPFNLSAYRNVPQALRTASPPPAASPGPLTAPPPSAGAAELIAAMSRLEAALA